MLASSSGGFGDKPFTTFTYCTIDINFDYKRVQLWQRLQGWFNMGIMVIIASRIAGDKEQH